MGEFGENARRHADPMMQKTESVGTKEDKAKKEAEGADDKKGSGAGSPEALNKANSLGAEPGAPASSGNKLGLSDEQASDLLAETTRDKQGDPDALTAQQSGAPAPKPASAKVRNPNKPKH